jgi:prepilin-type N-terminal cleavage/methylation domain-containing protein
MKPALKQQRTAMTFIELIVVIAIIAVLASMLLPALSKPPHSYRPRFPCSFNLNEIGRAYRLWADDHNGHIPSTETMSNGGWKERLDSPGQGTYCWTNFAIMANELGKSREILVCPADERRHPVLVDKNGYWIEWRQNDFMDNSTLSYFVGVGAQPEFPGSSGKCVPKS